jgi:hypothetical protein
MALFSSADIERSPFVSLTAWTRTLPFGRAG